MPFVIFNTFQKLRLKTMILKVHGPNNDHVSTRDHLQI